MRRSFHIIDIENLAGTAHADNQSIAFATAAYRQVIELGAMDQVIVGTNMGATFRLAVGLEWLGARVVSGHGPNGADSALLAAVDPGWIVRRGFDCVVIGSGDQCFAPLARTLKQAGVDVRVIGRIGAIHSSLWPASHHVAALTVPDSVQKIAGPPAPSRLVAAA